MASSTQTLAAFEYYIKSGGYYEKASAKNLTRSVSDFAANKGSGNYTWMGKVCGLNPGQWCAMMVSTAVYEACGNSRSAAKAAMWGRWPHYNCGTLFDDAKAKGRAYYSYYQRVTKGRGGTAYTPKPGDIIIFSDDGRIRTHTGMVYACDGTAVYCYEGNSANMARKRSYKLTSSYLYGFSQPVYDGEALSELARFQQTLGVTADGEYGPVTKEALIKAHQRFLNDQYDAGLAVDGSWGPQTFYATQPVKNGDDNDGVALWQGLLLCRGHDPKGIDGAFGPNTEAATEAFQTAAGLNPTGVADRYTWARAFGASRPAHTKLRLGSTGAQVRYMQNLLVNRGHVLAVDGEFGKQTEAAVKAFQSDNCLETDGVCGPLTWAELE